MDHVVSADGTVIAYELLGSGPPLVVVAGTNCDATVSRPLAHALAQRHTVLNYDRRGRGGSGDASPYAVRREVEDLQALLGRVGDGPAVYGHSSGAALVLHAAAAGLAVSTVVLHEPPYSADAAQAEDARAYVAELTALLAAGRTGDAAALFLTWVGTPAEAVAGMRAQPWWSRMEAFAPTLTHDAAVLGYPTSGGTVPVELAAAVRAPTHVLTGDASPPFMAVVGRQLAAALPHGRHHVLAAQRHVVPPEVLVPVVEELLAS